MDLSRFIDKQIRVKFAGGRECSGLLKGYDPLLNIVLDDTIEYLRDPDNECVQVDLGHGDPRRLLGHHYHPHLSHGQRGEHRQPFSVPRIIYDAFSRS